MDAEIRHIADAVREPIGDSCIGRFDLIAPGIGPGYAIKPFAAFVFSGPEAAQRLRKSTALTSPMCAHYESVSDKARLKAHFGIDLPSELARRDVWPGYLSTVIRRHPHADVGDDAVPVREALVGSFGLIPHWSKDTKIARHTYNARSETVAEKPSFRDAWRKAQHCIIPVETFFEPDWRSGKAVPTRIGNANGEPLGVAGLWAAWHDPKGTILHSFTMLTINADNHPLMNQFHKPTDEKRMIVILPPERYDDWLKASAKDSGEFLLEWPADSLQAAA